MDEVGLAQAHPINLIVLTCEPHTIVVEHCRYRSVTPYCKSAHCKKAFAILTIAIVIRIATAD